MARSLTRSARLAVASLIVTALAAQALIGAASDNYSLMRPFFWFTTVGGAVTAFCLTMLAIRPDSDSAPAFATFRAATTVYMFVVAVTWVFALTQTDMEFGIPEAWIDVSLHVFAPLFMLVDWLVNPPQAPPNKAAIAGTALIPAVFLIYAVVLPEQAL